MKVRKAGQNRSIGGRSNSLVPGQQVHGRVIAKLSPGFFRIGAGGQVFVAESELPLKEGQKLTARVEIGGDKVFLRINEDQSGLTSLPDHEIESDEILRVMNGLGYFPDEIEVIEFKERLDRYRLHGSFPGFEPSDVWVMAILWTRGLKAGSDAFALFSFYLRQIGMQPARPTNPVKLTGILSYPDIKSPDNVDSQRDDQSGASEDFVKNRWIETNNLLNKNEEKFGSYYHQNNAFDTMSAMFWQDLSKRLGRWVDNPVAPEVLIEAAQYQGVIRSRLYQLQIDKPTKVNPAALWKKCWRTSVKRNDWEVEEHEDIVTSDPEYLRLKFWRKWCPDKVRDVTV